MTRRTKRILALVILGLALAAAGAWLAGCGRRVNLRDFDPDAVARADAAMWRAYYAKDSRALLGLFGRLIRDETGVSYPYSMYLAFQGSRAAFVFKQGKGRAEFERALPPLVSLYRGIKASSRADFDPARAARLELDWWIIHRERWLHPPQDLDRALAAAAAEVYGIRPEAAAEYGHLRGEAMRVRDTSSWRQTPTEQDWQRVEELLRQAWRALWQAVNHDET